MGTATNGFWRINNKKRCIPPCREPKLMLKMTAFWWKELLTIFISLPRQSSSAFSVFWQISLEPTLANFKYIKKTEAVLLFSFHIQLLFLSPLNLQLIGLFPPDSISSQETSSLFIPQDHVLRGQLTFVLPLSTSWREAWTLQPTQACKPSQTIFSYGSQRTCCVTLLKMLKMGSVLFFLGGKQWAGVCWCDSFLIKSQRALKFLSGDRTHASIWALLPIIILLWL